MDEKYATNQNKEKLQHYKGEKCYMEQIPAKARCKCYGMLKTKENVQDVRLDFPCRLCSRQKIGTARLTGAVCRHFLRNILPELLQDVDLQAIIQL